MNFQIASRTAGSLGGIKQRSLATVCGIALAVSGVAGVGAWQATGHGTSNKPHAAPASFTTPGSVDRTDSLGGVAEQIKLQRELKQAGSASANDHLGGVAEQIMLQRELGLTTP